MAVSQKPLAKLFNAFFQSERSGGFLLIACTFIAIFLANSGMGKSYFDFWHTQVGLENKNLHLNHRIEYWINDGLMAIFFLMVGLEIEREIYVGELSNLKSASLPIFAALGGMLVPAAIHFIFNQGTDTQSGIGIPMATDIAFALGILSLVNDRIPANLKIFLAALAIIDDLGAIMIIAIFYTASFSLPYFVAAMGLFALLLAFNRFGVRHFIFYIIPGILMWYCMLRSGVHATISGVLLAFALPFGNGDEQSTSYKVQHFLHKPVAFFILPLFSLANAGIVFREHWTASLSSRNSLGIILGLLLGKPLGIFLFSYTAVKLKWSQLYTGLNWKYIAGAGILGGIGFTMSIFISLLAFKDAELIANAKIAVMLASLLSGVVGYFYLSKLKKMNQPLIEIPNK